MNLSKVKRGLKTNVHSFLGAIVQIMLLDIIFSLDSVITAVGRRIICSSWRWRQW